NLRVGLFTDTFDEINGVARFLRDMHEQSQRLGRNLIIHTCCQAPGVGAQAPGRRNFAPLLSRTMPYYPDLRLVLPPLLEILEWSDRQQFDAIHVSTPGPMGLCGWVAAKMLRVPLLATYHTDFPAYVQSLTRDHRVTLGTRQYMSWFYGQTAAVFSRSNQYRFNLHDLGVRESQMRTIPAAVNTEKFNPSHRNMSVWASHGVREPLRVLYCGRVSVEKNLPLLVEAFRQLCRTRNDAALVVAGDGPYLTEMRRRLSGTPAYFLGFQNDAQLGTLYSSSDLLVFPSRTDTLGQVVMEAQASGLPVIVSNEGGPREMTDDGVTGLVISSNDPAAWSGAMDRLLGDEPARLRMARTAQHRMSRHSLARTFEEFWAEHVAVVEPNSDSPGSATTSRQSAAVPGFPHAESKNSAGL
ncbi:MAG: glycosyltransferase family 4 protein, partial [Tepidisphaeraceae bacterium]